MSVRAPVDGKRIHSVYATDSAKDHAGYQRALRVLGHSVRKTRITAEPVL